MKVQLEGQEPPRFRIEVPPRLWARLEALAPRVFARLNDQLRAIAELANLRLTSVNPHPAVEMRFEAEGVEVFYSVDDERRTVTVRDVRRIDG